MAQTLQPVFAVLISHDTHFDSRRLHEARRHLRSAHVDFWLSDGAAARRAQPDGTSRQPPPLQPSSAALAAAVQSASGRNATLIGWPGRPTMDYLKVSLR